MNKLDAVCTAKIYIWSEAIIILKNVFPFSRRTLYISNVEWSV